MKNIILIFIVTFSVTCAAQTAEYNHLYDTSRDSTYYATYNKLKQLYIVNMYTDAYQQNRAKAREYRNKLRSSGEFDPKTLGKDHGGLNWLKDNWQKTEFKSYEEAVKEFDDLLAATLVPTKESEAYNEVYLEAIIKYGPEIFTDMFFELMKEYPDKI